MQRGGWPLASHRRILASERKNVEVGLDGNFLVVGERINPTGKKKLQAQLREGKLDLVREMAMAQEENGAAILLVTSDRHSPLAQQADHVLLASNREQRLIEGDHAPSQLSVLLVIEVLYYLMLLGE